MILNNVLTIKIKFRCNSFYFNGINYEKAPLLRRGFNVLLPYIFYACAVGPPKFIGIRGEPVPSTCLISP